MKAIHLTLLLLIPFISLGQIEIGTISSFLDGHENVVSYYDLYPSNPDKYRTYYMIALRDQKKKGENLRRMLDNNNDESLTKNVENIITVYNKLLNEQHTDSHEKTLAYLSSGDDIENIRQLLKKTQALSEKTIARIIKKGNSVALEDISIPSIYENAVNLVLKLRHWDFFSKKSYKDLQSQMVLWNQEDLGIKPLVILKYSNEKDKQMSLEWIDSNYDKNFNYYLTIETEKDEELPKLELIDKNGQTISTYIGVQKADFYEKLKQEILEYR